MTWEMRLIGALCASKRAGYTFDVGWALAIRENPPRSMVEKEIVASVRVFASDAWHDRKPVLRGFSLDSLRESDRTQEARSSGSFRVDSLVTA